MTKAVKPTKSKPATKVRLTTEVKAKPQANPAGKVTAKTAAKETAKPASRAAPKTAAKVVAKTADKPAPAVEPEAPSFEYKWSIVLVGWSAPIPAIPGPFTVSSVPPGLASLVEAHEVIENADMAIFCPVADLLAPPSLEDAEATWGKIWPWLADTEKKGSFANRKTYQQFISKTDWRDAGPIIADRVAEYWGCRRHKGSNQYRVRVFVIPPDIQACDPFSRTLWDTIIGVPRIVSHKTGRLEPPLNLWGRIRVPEGVECIDDPVIASAASNLKPGEVSFPSLDHLDRLHNVMDHYCEAPQDTQGLSTIHPAATLPDAEAFREAYRAACRAHAARRDHACPAINDWYPYPLLFLSAANGVTKERLASLGNQYAAMRPYPIYEEDPTRYWACRVRAEFDTHYFLPGTIDVEAVVKEAADSLFTRGMLWHAPQNVRLVPELISARNRVIEAAGAESPVLGESLPMLELYPKIVKAMQRPRAHIMVKGQLGTPIKALLELLKRTDDQAHSFYVMDFSAKDDRAIQSELFGLAYDHRPTGLVELVGQGTLVIDNAQLLSTSLQRILMPMLDQTSTYRKVGDTEAQRARCRCILVYNGDGAQPHENPAYIRGWCGLFDLVIHMPDLDKRKGEIPGMVSTLLHDKTHDQKLADDTLRSIKPAKEIVQAWQANSWSGAAGNDAGLLREVRRFVDDRICELDSRASLDNGQRRDAAVNSIDIDTQRHKAESDRRANSLAALSDRIGQGSDTPVPKTLLQFTTTHHEVGTGRIQWQVILNGTPTFVTKGQLEKLLAFALAKFQGEGYLPGLSDENPMLWGNELRKLLGGLPAAKNKLVQPVQKVVRDNLLRVSEPNHYKLKWNRDEIDFTALLNAPHDQHPKLPETVGKLLDLFRSNPR